MEDALDDDGDFPVAEDLDAEQLERAKVAAKQDQDLRQDCQAQDSELEKAKAALAAIEAQRREHRTQLRKARLEAETACKRRKVEPDSARFNAWEPPTPDAAPSVPAAGASGDILAGQAAAAEALGAMQAAQAAGEVDSSLKGAVARGVVEAFGRCS